ncbi:mechanosensitive ion channel family protein [Hydrogenovibrio thermophilus]|uniref:mechanosensitive ion channel family protein n=1 Tax=Hydrogenovibrio thermophilus TaxID=265883 RepID=UPI001CEF7815|nr:mechanosensitive ion channel family protein [Hydrogenovibrio thermophilus]
MNILMSIIGFLNETLLSLGGPFVNSGIEKALNQDEETLFEDFAKNTFTSTIDVFPEAWRYLAELFGGQIWLLLLLIVFAITLVVDVVFRIAIGGVDYYLDKHKKRFVGSITKSLKAPVSFYIWLSGLTLAIITMMNHFRVLLELKPYITEFKSTLGVIAVAWFSVRWVRHIEIHLKRLERKDSRWDSVTVEAGAKVFKLTVFVVTGLFVLSEMGVNLAGLIAFGGVGAMAVGFAAKDVIGNVLGGLMLYWDKPFSTGDWIRSPDKEIEGTVESIGWRLTVVRTFDKRPLYIPNGIFSTISIENPSRMTNRRIKQVIGLRYCDIDKMAAVTSGIKEMLKNHPEIDQNQTTFVNFVAYNNSTLDIMIYTFTKTTVWVRYQEIQEDVLLKVADVVASHGAEMAFPTRTLYVEDSVKLEPPGLAEIPTNK